MSDDFKQTVRIVRELKIATDERGHSVWAEPVETVDDNAEKLSLVSTQMLRRILAGDETDADSDAGGGFDPYNSG